MLPFHIWLPEAHVEAPTPGSVILASILLKLGTYAILRFLIGSFSTVSYDFISFILTFSLFGFIFPSLVALNQIDIKKNYSLFFYFSYEFFTYWFFFSFSILGLAGSFLMMFGHALTSAGLFFGIGAIYDRYKTRLLFYFVV